MANPNRYLAGWQGILQADTYGGYNDLYRADRDSGSVESALCWSHARRKFFEIADIKGNARKASPPMTSPLSRWRLWPGSTRTSISNAPSMARPPWNGWRRDRSRAHGSICSGRLGYADTRRPAQCRDSGCDRRRLRTKHTGRHRSARAVDDAGRGLMAQP